MKISARLRQRLEGIVAGMLADEDMNFRRKIIEGHISTTGFNVDGYIKPRALLDVGHWQGLQDVARRFVGVPWTVFY